jgi:hypothetical protein
MISSSESTSAGPDGISQTVAAINGSPDIGGVALSKNGSELGSTVSATIKSNSAGALGNVFNPIGGLAWSSSSSWEPNGSAVDISIESDLNRRKEKRRKEKAETFIVTSLSDSSAAQYSILHFNCITMKKNAGSNGKSDEFNTTSGCSFALDGGFSGLFRTLLQVGEQPNGASKWPQLSGLAAFFNELCSTSPQPNRPARSSNKPFLRWDLLLH